MKTVKATPDGVWTPTPESLLGTNVAWLMQHAAVDSYDTLYAWSVRERERYWAAVVERLGIRFQQPYERVLDLAGGVESP
ncbi:MAG: acetyl-coenzyme A synthetase N-terminal domain-containing protein, partial [Novipirellula sp. JB048]